MNDTMLKLLIVVVQRGDGEKTLNALDGLAFFPSIIRGRGTAPSDILSALGIGEPEKDMLFCFAEQKNIQTVYDVLEAKCDFKQKRGIAMTVPVSAVGGNITLQILLGKTKNLA